jgi:hypothetical protein
MKTLAALLLLVFGLIAPATAGEYSLANRPEVSFKGGPTHVSPYPQSKRAAAVWAADTCWNDCKSSCAWKMEACVSSTDADACRPQLDACDRSCQRSCRSWSSGPLGGPLQGLADIYLAPPIPK